MRMTSHTDYALRILIYLGTRPERTATVSDIAGAYGLSHSHLLKVALRLRRLGYIGTTRGRAGGLRLAMAPEAINVGALMRTTEDEFALVECLQARGNACVITPACRLKGMLSEALDAYLAVLDRYTLADILHNRAALAHLLGIADQAA
jgi:Rrf2 family nitric oxide-sensitive transcriptional repressor